MMPLIDVVFLLLTFFVFAMVVMVRLDVSDIRLPVGASGDAPLERVPAITVTLSQEGELAVNGEPADRDTIVLTLNELREATPDARVFIAADDTSSTGCNVLQLCSENVGNDAVFCPLPIFDRAGTPAACWDDIPPRALARLGLFRETVPDGADRFDQIAQIAELLAHGADVGVHAAVEGGRELTA